MTGRLSALLGLMIGGAFYLLLIDTTSLPELYAGAGATLLAAVAFETAREQGVTEARAPLRGFLRAGRVLRRVPAQIWLVSRAALAQLLRPQAARGSFRAVPFDAAGDGAGDAGRRALAEALGSLTPNTIVVGIDPGTRLILVHQLHVQGGREELDPLGLE
jgi:multisubunit Na+/H+ antiporter MnhE subunit